MAKFSEIMGLSLSQPELDFVDINPGRDLPLFIDPYAISIRDDDWSLNCNDHIVSFFQTAIDYLKNDEDALAQQILQNLGEPNETCLGLSKGPPSGRGVSGKQALDLYASLSRSRAAKSGLLSQLAECDLFIPGIGRDKISDITTNILRALLIEYTQDQCYLHGIPLTGTVASGKLWDINEKKWVQKHVALPVVNGRKIILVPKSIVRHRMCIDGAEYYNHFVLNFLQEEHLKANSSLVQVLKNKNRVVRKTALKEEHPFSKEWLADFSERHPDVLEKYKDAIKNMPGADGLLDQSAFSENYNEALFAQTLMQALQAIPVGPQAATRYHTLIIGILEFIFWPNLIYPKKEADINEGRKRIDIIYTNAARSGFFDRVHRAPETASNILMVECKNYKEDPTNEAVDQLAGRFNPNRGWLGFLVYRTDDDYQLMLKRCKDTAKDQRGFIIPLGDEQILNMLQMIAEDRRRVIDRYLSSIFAELIS